MARNFNNLKIYKSIAATLEKVSCKREDLIKNALISLRLSKEELSDRSVGSLNNKLRSRIGAIVTKMLDEGLIFEDAEGYYSLTDERPAVIRLDRCEKETVKALSEGNLTKKALRARLIEAFGADKTATLKDDETLSLYMSRILKHLISLGAVSFVNGQYTLTERVRANADNINELLALKSDFLHRLHAKGGEFFENYFMTLLKKHYERHKKEVIECYVTGGSDDGGIDGVIKTRDEMGFIETTMVQTKNRNELSSETDVRGFYGALCAKRGTRGIFATTSDFHTTAQKFLDSIDDCIGVGGDKIFKLAIECQYGIKKDGKSLVVDDRLI